MGQPGKANYELDDLQKEHEGLLEKIREVEKKIAELEDKLLRANQDGETAQKIEEEIRGQKKLLANPQEDDVILVGNFETDRKAFSITSVLPKFIGKKISGFKGDVHGAPLA